MGFLFENLLVKNPPANLDSYYDIENANSMEPSTLIQAYYESRIEELNVRNILKRYLKQTLKEILTEVTNIDKIFLFEIRELLKKVTKRNDETDFPEFIELLNELFLICIDKEISNENKIGGGAREDLEETEMTIRNDSLFVRAIQRQALTTLISFDEVENE